MLNVKVTARTREDGTYLYEHVEIDTAQYIELLKQYMEELEARVWIALSFDTVRVQS